MKKTLFTLTATLIVLATMAQNEVKKSSTQGTVYYQQVNKLNIQLEGDAAQFANALPKERKSRKLLHFNSNASLYKKDISTDNEDVIRNESGGMVIKMQEPNEKIFTDLKANQQIEQKEFMTRQFLIEREIGQDKWKFSGNNKTIMGYACQEATLEKKDEKIKVWFTPEIPVSTGPRNYIGLPGLVLAVDINDGETTLEATLIKTEKINETHLQKPKKGKKVSDEEYHKIVDEKLKEMGVEGGQKGGHRVMIKIRN